MKPAADLPLPAWQRLLAWCLRLRPAPLRLDGRERLRVVGGAALGLGLVGLLCQGGPFWPALPGLIAPLGASTVLAFGVPASPLAQPWAVVAGNGLSALVGVACVHLVGGPTWLVAALAVALAMAVMIPARCLHPPGGAMALLVVLSGQTHWQFALLPAALHSLLLVLAAMAYNSATGRPYPHGQVVAQAEPRPPAQGPAAVGRDEPAPAAPVSPWAPRSNAEDLAVVLARYNQVVDLPLDDLQDLTEAIERQAIQRRMATLRCRDLMSPAPCTVSTTTPLEQAWSLLQIHRVKALPVVDRQDGVVGILTRADLLRARGGGVPGADRVGEVMARQVRVIGADRPVADLLTLLLERGHHHIPVIEAGNRLVGMVTQTDLLRALAAGLEPAPRAPESLDTPAAPA